MGSSSVVERFREIRVLRLWLQTSFLESARNARYALVRTRIRWPQRKLRPLEPGHFLTDPAAPRRGKLLDVGSGLSRSLGGQGGPSFQELLQMEEEPTSTKVESQPTMSQWMMQILRRVKYATCTPAAAAVYPYIATERLVAYRPLLDLMRVELVCGVCLAGSVASPPN